MKKIDFTVLMCTCYFDDPKNLENIIIKQFNYAINKSK